MQGDIQQSQLRPLIKVIKCRERFMCAVNRLESGYIQSKYYELTASGMNIWTEK